MSNVKRVVKYLLGLIVMTLLYAMLDNVGGIKKYICVLSACLFFLIFGRKKKWSAEILLCAALPMIVYIIIGSFTTLFSAHTQTTAVKVAVYWIVPLVFAFSMYIFWGEKMPRIVDVQFWGCCLAYKIFDAPLAFGIYTWESVYAFTFGIFSVYYAYKKRWGNLAISLFFVYLAEKRIAILAVLLALLLMGMLWLFNYSKKLVLILWGGVIGSIYIYIYLIYSGIMEKICWGANINTNGRAEMYSRVAEKFEFSLMYLGEGLGIVEKLLEYWKFSMYNNLHNDLLKFYIELGFVGLLLYLISYGVMFHFTEKLFGKPQMCFLFGISVYSMLLFATDNTSIYMIYLIPFYSSIFAVLGSNREMKCHIGGCK